MTQAAQITEALAHWHRGVAEQDMEQLRAIVADDAVFRSPFLWQPKPGRERVLMVLRAAAQVFADFTYHRALTDGTSWALEFSARVGVCELKGVDLLRFNEAGLITELEVLVRPAKGLQALAEAMAKQLAAQGDYERFING